MWPSDLRGLRGEDSALPVMRSVEWIHDDAPACCSARPRINSQSDRQLWSVARPATRPKQLYGFFGCWLLESFLYANQLSRWVRRWSRLRVRRRAFREKAPHLANDPACSCCLATSSYIPDGDFQYVIHAATTPARRLQNASHAVLVHYRWNRRVPTSRRTRHAQNVVSSSGAVYGVQHPRHAPSGNTSWRPDWLKPLCPLRRGKRAAELMTMLHAHQVVWSALSPRLCLRRSASALDQHFAIGNFIRDAMQGLPIRIHGDVHHALVSLPSDLAVWLWTMLLALLRRSLQRWLGGSNQHAELARASSRRSASPQRFSSRVKSSRRAVHTVRPSTAKAREQFGLRAQVDLRHAIRYTAEWHRARSIA